MPATFGMANAVIAGKARSYPPDQLDQLDQSDQPDQPDRSVTTLYGQSHRP